MKYPTKLPPEASGNSKETNWFRQLMKCIRERSLAVGPGLRISYKTDGTLIEIVGKETTAAVESVATGAIQRFIIDEIYDKYLVCRKATEAGVAIGTQTYRIAKPLELRVSAISTQFINQTTRKRFVGASGAYVNEEMQPPYEVGSAELYASLVEGDSSVVDPEAPSTNPTQKLEWLDVNVEGRHWRASYYLVSVCVNESGTLVTKQMYVAGGPTLGV